MNTAGNLELLREELKKHYQKLLDDFEKEQLELFTKDRLSIDSDHDIALRKKESEMINEEKKVYTSTMADEVLHAKKEYEQKREDLLIEAFKQAEERSGQVLKNPEYIERVKRSSGEGKVRGTFEEYRGLFPDIQIDTSINGITIEKDTLTLDFTFTRFLEAQKQELRNKIARRLFYGS
ncbi:hypothetical protein GOV09_03710 [Candidatus Woesearchaeota archaeon]|nr:hypothetical protein [Candidatus Woesearchaeota archaeon]